MTQTVQSLNYGPFVLFADISEHQGSGVDLRAHANAGFNIISMRVSNGGRLDNQADNYNVQAIDQGIKRLFYAWVRADGTPRQVQLDLLKRAQDRYGEPELGWMLDVEDPNIAISAPEQAALVDWIAAGVTSLDPRHRLPVIYTSGWYWDPNVGMDVASDCPLIVASYPYQTNTGAPLKPAPSSYLGYASWALDGPNGTRFADGAVPRRGGWDTWDAWQITSIASGIPGFPGRIDLNLGRPAFINALITGAYGAPGSIVNPPRPPIITPPTPDIIVTKGPAMQHIILFTNDHPDLGNIKAGDRFIRAGGGRRQNRYEVDMGVGENQVVSEDEINSNPDWMGAWSYIAREIAQYDNPAALPEIKVPAPVVNYTPPAITVPTPHVEITVKQS